MNRVLLKLSGEALAGDRKQALMKKPVWQLQSRLKLLWTKEYR